MIGAALSGEYNERVEGLFSKKLETINGIQIGLSTINNDVIVYAKEYPGSIKGLAKVLSICDYVIYIPSSRMDAIDAEMALAVEFSNVKNGVTLIDESTDTDRMDTLFKSLKISEFRKADNLGLRNLKPDKVDSLTSNSYASIDKYFLVRGIGAVMIGFVINGEIRRNQRYYLLPSGRQVSVKNIQIMDEDKESAKRGEYAGIALNNAGEKDLAENYGLSDSCEVYDKFTASFDPCKFYSRSVDGIDMTSAFNGREISLKKAKEDGRDIYISSEKIPLTNPLLLMDSSIGRGKNRVIGKLKDLKPV
ncbi:MAG: hypothetical protein QXJ12_01480 [Candidatus Parvarchaeota archaeon]|nr:hypothetical protein [Candidatus Parvarchaeota archaeon]